VQRGAQLKREKQEHRVEPGNLSLPEARFAVDYAYGSVQDEYSRGAAGPRVCRSARSMNRWRMLRKTGEHIGGAQPAQLIADVNLPFQNTRDPRENPQRIIFDHIAARAHFQGAASVLKR
jgi:hypothetical protein